MSVDLSDPNLRKLARDPQVALRHHRKRKKSRNRGRHTQTLPVDPAVIQRQYSAFELRVSGATFRDIENTLGCDHHTVISDIEAETRRRQVAISGSKRAHQTLSVSRYEGVILRAMTRLEQMMAKDKLGIPGALRLAFIEERLVLEAQKRIDAVQGLTRIIAGDDDPAPPADKEKNIQIVAHLYQEMTPEIRLALLQECRARKALADPAIKNVTLTSSTTVGSPQP